MNDRPCPRGRHRLIIQGDPRSDYRVCCLECPVIFTVTPMDMAEGGRGDALVHSRARAATRDWYIKELES